jgi:dipeptidyl aminopeptidase/acylaminoacyl peptidase
MEKTSPTLDQILSIRPLVGVETPQWSPDGSRIAFVSSLGGTTNLWSMPSKGGFPTRLTVSMGDVNFLASRAPLWASTDNYLSYISKKTGTDEVWLWPTDGSEEIQLTHLGGLIHSMAWSPDGQSVAVACNRNGAYEIYRVDVPSGEAHRLTEGPLYAVNPVFTPDGKHIAYVRLDDTWEDHDVMIITRDGKDSRVVAVDTDFFDYTYGKTFGTPNVSADNKTVVFRSQRNGHTNIWTAPIDGGEPAALAPEEAEQDNAVWSPSGRQVAFTSNNNGTLEIRVSDAGNGGSRAIFSPGIGVCSNLQWSPDGTAIAFRYGTPTTPADIWTVSLKDGHASQLTDASPGGGLTERLMKPEKVAFKSFDGLTIHGYLYSPSDKSQKYPGLLYIHGGPTNQFYDDLQVNVQYLVQRGYVVLLPNIRGSSGYGKVFEEANDKDWGGGDLKDAIAGRDYLKGLKYVDAENIGIMGRSYGGILSMCAISFAPGAFQAAVPISGYGDWPSLQAEMELRHNKMQVHEFGSFEENSDVWYDCSPFYKIENATTPTFVLHGEGKDPSSDASRLFAVEMKRLYKTVEYKVYHNDGYYVDAPANVRQLLLDVADFLDRYLKAG